MGRGRAGGGGVEIGMLTPSTNNLKVGGIIK